ncbi:YbfB/YjiJ family MFS transporter [Vibrio marisflavi]|nr:YbfB/YjiJ family MFS transporter [Vibrio marisflavi]
MSIDIKKAKVLFAGIASLILSVGIARFSYTPMLTILQSQTGLSQSAGAWLASTNYIGYFVGALLVATIHDIQLKDKCYRISMILAVLSTFMMASSQNVWVWATLMFFAGASSTGGVLMSSGLVLNWLLTNKKSAKLGLHFSGVGLGIIIAALLPEIARSYLTWSQLYIVYGGLSLALLYPALAWLPKPIHAPNKAKEKNNMANLPSARFLTTLKLGYFCAGVGYVVNATFIVAIVNQALGQGTQGYLIFILLGIAAAPSPIMWDKISHHIGNLNALVLACLLQTAGILIPAASSSLPWLLVSAILFGNTFIAIVNIVMTMSGHYSPSNPAKMMAKMTISYSIAQVVAPMVVAMMTAHSLDYLDGLLLAGVVMIGGTLCMLRLKFLDRSTSSIIELARCK